MGGIKMEVGNTFRYNRNTFEVIEIGMTMISVKHIRGKGAYGIISAKDLGPRGYLSVQGLTGKSIEMIPFPLHVALSCCRKGVRKK
jgi:hypothetical protein